MASKRDELKAFKKLCDAFPNAYCTLDIEMKQYSTDTVTDIKYHAYASPMFETPHLGREYKDPMEAVNEVLEHFGKEI